MPEFPQIDVTFIDDMTGKPFGITKCTADALPMSFALDTTLHIESQDWSVINASPQTRAEYVESGQLTLRVRRIHYFNPAEILFSLPSLCDALAPLSSAALSGDELILHEDNWRQLEFVSNAFGHDIEEEIASIRRIHEENAAKVGWSNLHVRKKPVRPIVNGPTLSRLAPVIDVHSVRGVSYNGASCAIEHGFSMSEKGGLTLYGTAPGARVAVLAVDSTTSDEIDTVQGLAAIAAEFDLCLVNWCRCVRALPDDPWFKALLQGQYSP